MSEFTKGKHLFGLEVYVREADYEALFAQHEAVRAALSAAESERDSLRAEVGRQRAEVNSAYNDRSRVLALLAALYPSHLMPHNEALGDDSWHQDWQTVLAIQLPTGQATWHLHKDDVALFNHIHSRLQASDWDGHTTEEKNQRLALAAQRAASPTGKYELEAEVERLKRQLAKLEERNQRQADESDNLTAENEKLRAEVELLQSVALQANNDRAELRAEVERLKAERDERGLSAKEVQELKNSTRVSITDAVTPCGPIITSLPSLTAPDNAALKQRVFTALGERLVRGLSIPYGDLSGVAEAIAQFDLLGRDL